VQYVGKSYATQEEPADVVMRQCMAYTWRKGWCFE
jgi:hypothetical protein